MTDSDYMLIRIGRALLDADARAKATLVDRTIDRIESEFRSTRIKMLANKLADSALDGIVDLEPNQAAYVRCLAQMCWIMENKRTDPYIAGRWHDLGQRLWQASHILAALVEGADNESS